MAAKKGKSAKKSATKNPSASKPANKDWFEDLDAELEEKTERALEMDGGESSMKDDLNRTLISDFWKIILRFEKINIHFAMEPHYNQFAQFEKFPFDWSLKDNFDYGGQNQIQIMDITRDQSRTGDTLRARYYNKDDIQHLRLSFEYCEGEHYYKYSGWKRIFGEFIAYDAKMNNIDIDQIHAILADIVRVWYESHLRRDRGVILTHLTNNYEKGETFTR